MYLSDVQEHLCGSRIQPLLNSDIFHLGTKIAIRRWLPQSHALTNPDPMPPLKLPTLRVPVTCALAIAATASLGYAADTAAPAAPAAPATATPAAATPTPATPKPKPPQKPRTAQDALTPTVKDPQRHEAFLKRIKEGPVDLLFLGDSITDFWPHRAPDSWAKFAQYHPADFGISADRTEHVIWRITNGELDGISPKLVVIMIGTNNIGHFNDEKPEWAAAGVKKIVDIVREKLPHAKVLLLGVFPRDAKDSPHRKAVEAINAIISKYDDGKTVHYLDIGKKFLDENGELPKDVMPDRLHPNAKGYEIWYEAIQPSVDELMK